MFDSEGSLCTSARGPSSLVRGWDNETVGKWDRRRMGRFDGGRLGGWEDRRRGRARREAGGKKDGARKKTKPYTTIPSRGFARNPKATKEIRSVRKTKKD